jgi:hypothetical protein
MRLLGWLGRFAVGVVVLGCVPLADAYYHFIRYASRSGPFVPIYEKFDLSSLPAGVVQVLVSEQGPEQLAPGDSLPGLYSQVRLASDAWNNVPASSLKVAFGGFFTPGARAGTPAIEVVFDEVEPGLIALGGPTSRDTIREGPQGPFVPILRSTVILRRDLSTYPSFSERFFLTLVHELGHALGLQHTLTSSVMATEVTRGVTKASPLDADDRAGIALLYPAPEFRSKFGSISGRVVRDGAGVALASVVAISANGSAVSTLTHPDGTYRIEGIPPGSYFLYAHPLPPPLFGERTPANIVPPSDAEGQAFAFGSAFGTLFYPGVRSPEQAALFEVGPGSVLEGIDFAVASRESPAIYAVQSFGFPGQVAVRPAHLMPGGNRNFIVAFGFGLITNGQPVPGLSVAALGGAATPVPNGLTLYGPDPRFLQIGLAPNPEAPVGPKHVIFSVPGDIYVLPNAFRLVREAPPLIHSITLAPDPNGDGRNVVVEGLRLSGATKILFAGVSGRVVSASKTDTVDRLVVQPPPAQAGQRVPVAAFNPDGQSSLFLQGDAPPVFEYLPPDPPANGPGVIQPHSLVPGTELAVDISTNGSALAGTDVSLAFGTSDVAVRRLWVLSPTRLVANIAVASNAVPGSTTLTIVDGLRLLNSPLTVTIQPSPGRVVSMRGPVVDAETGRVDIPAGQLAAVRLFGVDPGLPASAFEVFVAERRATVVSFSEGLLKFQIPPDAARGPAFVRVTANREALPPLVLSVDRTLPVVTAVQNLRGLIGLAFRSGERLILSVVGLTEDANPIALEKVTIEIGGVRHRPLVVTPYTGQPGAYEMHFTLEAGIPAGVQPLIVTFDGRSSRPYQIVIAGPI